MRTGRLISAACVASTVYVAPAFAQPDEQDIDAFARVSVTETELRAGPGVSHRVIYRAERGETFLIDGREGTGFWLRVYLDDGRVAYVLGDTVDTIAVDENTKDAPSKPGFFSPPALQDATGGFAMMGGVFDENGYVEIRPALVLAPPIAIEPYAGLGLTSEGQRFIYGAGGTLDLAPDWAVSPYLHVGGGGVSSFPNEDAFVLKEESVFHARASAGLLISLRLRVSVRLEFSNFVLFTEDFYQSTQSYIGGLGTYF